jgi:hypothetical protein
LVVLGMFMGIHGLYPPWEVEAITILDFNFNEWLNSNMVKTMVEILDIRN